MPCKAAYLSKIRAGFPLTLRVMVDNICWYSCLFLCPHIQTDCPWLSTATVWIGTQKQSVFMEVNFQMNIPDCIRFARVYQHTFAWGNKLPTKLVHSIESSGKNSLIWSDFVWSPQTCQTTTISRPAAGHCFRNWAFHPLIHNFNFNHSSSGSYLLSNTSNWQCDPV